MKNTFLLQFLEQLSYKEWEEARKWLQSPVHNERTSLVLLFDYLRECTKEEVSALDRRQAYAALAPSMPFDDQQLRLNCTYLLRCLEEWLAWRYWERSNEPPQQYLLQAYREREMHDFFLREERRLRKKMDQHPYRDHRFLLRHFQLEFEHYQWQSDQGRTPTFDFKVQDVAFQKFIIAFKLRLACANTAHRNVSGEKYTIVLLSELLALAQLPPYCDSPIIRIYYQTYLMQEGDEPEVAFQQYQQLLRAHLALFPVHEKRDLLVMGINFCIRRINVKGKDYLRQILVLYQQGLANEVLYHNGWLSGLTYTNITIAAVAAGEINWGHQFVEDYRGKLSPQERTSIYALNAARVTYAHGDHRQALLHLHRFESKDFFHQVSARLIQLKIYYEDHSFQLLAAHIKNTRAFLRRQKRHPYHQKIYFNILYLTEQLMKLAPYDQAQRTKVRELIEQTTPLTEKDWLLAQL